VKALNILLAGVGGQGTILASDILVRVGLAAGFQVKQAEVHGMSQRGGSVTSHVRWGTAVHSPLAGAGEVDVLLAFEQLEALRYLPQVRAEALVLISREKIIPVTVTSAGQIYPDDDTVRTAVAQVTSHCAFVDGLALARELGEPKAANVVLLGALAGMLADLAMTEPEPTDAIWQAVIAERVPPKTVALNRRAFWAGRHAVALPA
jgi:indolepyruvate ferredoxin oxidoreductase beta subunit